MVLFVREGNIASDFLSVIGKKLEHKIIYLSFSGSAKVLKHWQRYLV